MTLYAYNFSEAPDLQIFLYKNIYNMEMRWARNTWKYFLNFYFTTWGLIKIIFSNISYMHSSTFLDFIVWFQKKKKKKTRVLLDYIKTAHTNLDQKNQISHFSQDCCNNCLSNCWKYYNFFNMIEVRFYFTMTFSFWQLSKI